MSTAGIVARGVRRSFGSVHAVRDIGFEAPAGAVTGLVGPNGAGKTTLLLMLASLLAPDAGELRVGGVDPVADPAHARRLLGWMPDSLGAWPSLTARETLAITARLYGMSKPDAAHRAAELLDLVGLTELADSPARVLSRGQKQKLGLARALVHDPQVLLLDEPASGLDPQARIQLRELLRRLAAEGRTVLISSHVLVELDEVVDEAVFLVAGRTVDAEAPTIREWRIRVLGDPAAAIAALGEASIRNDRGGLIVSFASEAEAAESLRSLVSSGVLVTEFAPVFGALESTFLGLEPGPPPPGAPLPEQAPPAVEGPAS